MSDDPTDLPDWLVAPAPQSNDTDSYEPEETLESDKPKPKGKGKPRGRPFVNGRVAPPPPPKPDPEPEDEPDRTQSPPDDEPPTELDELAERYQVPIPTINPLAVKLREQMFEAIFPMFLERIVEGYTATAALDEDVRKPERGAMLQWVNRDRMRKMLFEEAKEIRTEVWASKLIEIADAENSMEDIQRSKLRIETYWRLMETDNAKRYRAKNQVELTGSNGGPLTLAATTLAGLKGLTDEELSQMASMLDRAATTETLAHPNVVAIGRTIEQTPDGA